MTFQFDCRERYRASGPFLILALSASRWIVYASRSRDESAVSALSRQHTADAYGLMRQESTKWETL